MAYINERVPEEERRSFLIPGYKREHTVGKWTIDKEKDYILFKYHQTGITLWMSILLLYIRGE